MSKIDDFNKAKHKHGVVTEFADRISRKHSSSGNAFLVDKFGADVKLGNTWRGEYGNSSTYNWPDVIKDELVKQIQLELRQLIVRASVRVAFETEEIRKEAMAEAQAVLVEINGESK